MRRFAAGLLFFLLINPFVSVSGTGMATAANAFDLYDAVSPWLHMEQMSAEEASLFSTNPDAIPLPMLQRQFFALDGALSTVSEFLVPTALVLESIINNDGKRSPITMFAAGHVLSSIVSLVHKYATYNERSFNKEEAKRLAAFNKKGAHLHVLEQVVENYSDKLHTLDLIQVVARSMRGGLLAAEVSQVSEDEAKSVLGIARALRESNQGDTGNIRLKTALSAGIISNIISLLQIQLRNARGSDVKKIVSDHT